MPLDPQSENIRKTVAIAVGTALFLLFMLLCYMREFGPKEPLPASSALKVFAGFLVGLSACIALIGVVEASGHPPGERGFGLTLAVQGLLLFVLTLLAWLSMGPVPALYWSRPF